MLEIIEEKYERPKIRIRRLIQQFTQNFRNKPKWSKENLRKISVTDLRLSRMI